MSEPIPDGTRRAIFHFIDGSQVAIEWPQIEHKGVFALENAVKSAVTAPQFLVEVDGNLMVIQMSAVKYIEISPAPKKLPDGVVREGRRVDGLMT